MDFEFNKSTTLSSNGLTPVRTVGERPDEVRPVARWDHPGLGLHRWVTSGSPATVCEASNSLPCWGTQALTGNFEGSINSAPVVDPVAPDNPRTLSARTFGKRPST